MVEILGKRPSVLAHRWAGWATRPLVHAAVTCPLLHKQTGFARNYFAGRTNFPLDFGITNALNRELELPAGIGRV